MEPDHLSLTNRLRAKALKSFRLSVNDLVNSSKRETAELTRHSISEYHSHTNLHGTSWSYWENRVGGHGSEGAAIFSAAGSKPVRKNNPKLRVRLLDVELRAPRKVESVCSRSDREKGLRTFAATIWRTSSSSSGTGAARRGRGWHREGEGGGL